MKKYCMPVLLVFVLIAGCTEPDGDKMAASNTPKVSPSPAPFLMPLNTPPASLTQAVSSSAATSQPAENIQKFDEISHASAYENKSVAVEVNYRKYVDWFMAHNLNIRGYTPEEYVCGQYTVDMINDSAKAGYKAYFAAITFTDGSGHALVSFKSTVGYSSWYFFEPQTNKLMSQESIAQVLNQNLGKTVSEVNVYGYFDDAGDKDPTTWRFSYPLYTKKY